MLADNDRAAIQERLQAMKNPVVLELFESSLGCESCTELKQLLKEVCDLSDLLSLKVYNIYVDEQHAAARKVDRVPVLHITDETLADTGIRFFGAPAGYEFVTLLQDILMVSSRDSGLQDETKAFLKTLTQPIDLTVFVTPTCPYCPAAVHLAHKMAYESPWIKGNMVECTEFPEWANEFQVRGVPKTVMGGIASLSVDGAVPESTLLARIMEASVQTPTP